MLWSITTIDVVFRNIFNNVSSVFAVCYKHILVWYLNWNCQHVNFNCASIFIYWITIFLATYFICIVTVVYKAKYINLSIVCFTITFGQSLLSKFLINLFHYWVTYITQISRLCWLHWCYNCNRFVIFCSKSFVNWSIVE